MSLELKGHVEVALSFEEFVLEFDPVESDGVKTTFKDVHHHQDSHSHCPEGEEEQERHDDDSDHAFIGTPGFGHALLQEHGS